MTRDTSKLRTEVLFTTAAVYLVCAFSGHGALGYTVKIAFLLLSLLLLLVGPLVVKLFLLYPPMIKRIPAVVVFSVNSVEFARASPGFFSPRSQKC